MLRPFAVILSLGSLLLAALVAGCQQKQTLQPAAPSSQMGAHGPQRIPPAARPPAPLQAR